MGEDFLSLREIADKMGLNIRTIEKWVKEGKMKAVKAGRVWLVKREDYEAYINGLPSNRNGK